MKSEVQTEIKRNLRAIAILIIVIVLINFNISLATLLNFTQDKKIIWTLDFGIYNILVSMIFSVIYYFYSESKLQIEIDILNKREDTNELTIRENPEEIYVQLKHQNQSRQHLKNIHYLQGPHQFF